MADSNGLMEVDSQAELDQVFDRLIDLHASVEQVKGEVPKEGAFRAGRVMAVNPNRKIAILAPLKADPDTGTQVPDHDGSPIIASSTRCHVTLGTNAGVVRSAGSWIVTCSEDHLPCISGVAL